MTRGIQIEPPIVVGGGSGVVFTLSTIEQVIDFVRRHPHYSRMEELRDACFVAAAVPSPENIEKLRKLTQEAFRAG